MQFSYGWMHKTFSILPAIDIEWDYGYFAIRITWIKWSISVYESEYNGEW